jgi:hypothetical protein
MRNLRISVIVTCLTVIGTAGCGSDTGGGQAGAGGSGGVGGAGGAGGGGDACAGQACGDACTTCPEGAPCACNAEGACVGEALAVCSPCPATPPTDGEACAPAGLVCETEEGIIIVCRSRTTCTANGWLTTAPGCSIDPAPDPACPAAQPSGTCDKTVNKELCKYGDPFCGCSDCLGGGPCGGQAEWVCAAPPSAPCPAIAPKLGAVCADDGLSCVYGTCYLGGTSGGRTCEGGIWTEDILPCPQ